MRLKAAVLEVVRGAAGATLLVAVGCSGSESIARELAPPVAPAPLFVASPPSVDPAPGTLPAGKPAVTPSVVIAPVAPPAMPPTNVDDVLAHADPDPTAAPVGDARPPRARPGRGRPRPREVEPLARPIGLPPNIAAPCGRG